MIEYLTKTFIISLILYLCFLFFFKRSRHYQMNRFILLFSILFSLLIPLIKISLPEIQQINILPIENLVNVLPVSQYIITPETVSSLSVNSTFTLLNILTSIYFIITVFLFVKFLYNIHQLINLSLNSDKTIHNGTELSFVDQKISPFSFFKTIFVNQYLYQNDKIENELILHEIAHKRQFHSIDILLIELIKAIFWFNPVVYFFNRLIKPNHEFLADEFVIISGTDKIEYSNKLLNYTVRNKKLNLSSGFDYSLIKNRLIMLSKNGQKRTFKYQLVLFIPITIVLFLSAAFTTTNNIMPIEMREFKSISINNQENGVFYADTLFWSGENNEIYFKGKVKVKYNKNDFTGNGSFSILDKVDVLYINNKPISLNSTIELTGKKCRLVELSKKEALRKYGIKKELKTVEIQFNI